MESLVHMVILCLVWRPLSAAVHSGRTISHSLLQCTRAPTSTSSPVPSTFLSFLPFSLPPSPPSSLSFSSSSVPFPSFPFSFLAACLLSDVVTDSHLALCSHSPVHSPSCGPYPYFFTAVLVGVWERAGIAHSVYHCNWVYTILNVNKCRVYILSQYFI